MRTIALANSKGGTGKTTVAVTLAEGLVRGGARVLLVDADPQANATAWLLGPAVTGNGAADAMVDEMTASSVVEVGQRAFAMLPSTPLLGASAIRLGGEFGGHTLLAQALKRLAKKYDYALIDTRPGPPAGDLLLMGALYAAQHVIVPVLPGAFSLAGYTSVQLGLRQMRDRLHARTVLLGALLFAVDPREALPAECREWLRAELKEKLFKTEIRKSIVAASLPAQKRTAWDGFADRRGAEDYRQLVDEVVARLGATR